MGTKNDHKLCQHVRAITGKPIPLESSYPAIFVDALIDIDIYLSSESRSAIERQAAHTVKACGTTSNDDEMVLYISRSSALLQG